jgi:hypothetical protein
MLRIPGIAATALPPSLRRHEKALPPEGLKNYVTRTCVESISLERPHHNDAYMAVSSSHGVNQPRNYRTPRDRPRAKIRSLLADGVFFYIRRHFDFRVENISKPCALAGQETSNDESSDDMLGSYGLEKGPGNPYWVACHDSSCDMVLLGVSE